MPRVRRCLAPGLLTLLLASLATAQAGQAERALGQAAGARAASSVMAVRDSQGLVTVIAEQASVRDVVRILSRWFDFPTLNLEAVPDVRVPVRFERVPAAQVVQRLVRTAGLPSVTVTPRARRGAAPPAALILVHDGQGFVTVIAEEAPAREVLSILSRWFQFPVVNPEAIPDTRAAMRFERVPVVQLVDRLLRGVGLNYVILTNPQTSIPSKVVAAPLTASQASGTMPPVNAVGPVGGHPGVRVLGNPPINAGTGMPMPGPYPMPVDPAMPVLTPDPPPQQVPMPPPPQTAPSPAPGATKPGVMTPAKPPG